MKKNLTQKNRFTRVFLNPIQKGVAAKIAQLGLAQLRGTTVHKSRTSNIAFLMDWAQISDLDFGLIRQNISIKKA